jgi:hypothetical protein
VERESWSVAGEFAGNGKFGRHALFDFVKENVWRQAHLLECRLISQ